ncbi:putative copper resistance-associated P-type ATPase [Aspergillus campestris IBT 28561]|uniref:Copper resistance-associated P-type ATPase n=1 Tax=Aspergillus campestris (strain IBT 28561) TaxID=1392248 RepID=A0A2I1DF89_ASPC2|nr:putative copper resistance-associated P-type ATPase [Aspergillus campestris IBT 28561]PKY08537.1 putative copper resistance-associated P-type ATPase [Aspergillus campestris IBT 28561]
MPALAEQGTQCLRSIFFVSNVHCSSCVAYISEVLDEIPGLIELDVSIFTHEVRAVHTVDTKPSDLATALIQAAFEVHHVTTYDLQGTIVSDMDTSSWLPRDSILFSPQSNPQPISNQSAQRHAENCDACRKEELEIASTDPAALERTVSVAASAEGSVTTHVTSSSQSPKDHGRFRARVSIGGMSCASCVNSITDEVKHLDFVLDATVNLLTNSATLVYRGPQENINKVVEQIDDIGFEASVDEVSPEEMASPSGQRPSSTFVAELAINGMTCGSCVGAVTRGLQELPFVTDVSINLLTHGGRVEFNGRENLDAVTEKVEDLGYDVSVNSVSPTAAVADETETRSIAIHIDGMFCHHCPEKVYKALEKLPDISVDPGLSVKNPILKVTYIPHAPSFTIREILQTAEKAHDSFVATVYHPPSIEDRSRAMQRQAKSRLLARFLFVLLVVIPTFVIGIVFMTLVSPENKTRKYLEQPIWAGNVSRQEWALLIMATPVMLYGADLFHVRAIKEIYSLWRPGSRVPVLRRFYRFGSMNLLISAGTTVAYVSSLAVLIMDAVADTSSDAHSANYFDSVVFLTFFILAGRLIEAYSKAKTGDAVAALGQLRPSEALLVTGGGEIQRISYDLLEIGDVVSIPHGASPPADGNVVGPGSYQFDESSLTGESRPVSKKSGDAVYTGSVNVGQPVQIKVSALGAASMLDQIIAVVREGQSRRAPLERFADILTSHFVPVITLIAILTFVIWLALGLSGALPADYLDNARGGWTFWSLEFAIAVFVVACPCGLALAAPTALFVGGGLAAKQGILAKGGGEAFQEASNLDAIVFDKTGTLTEGGSLKVSDHESLVASPEQVQAAWALARKLEESSNHPIARAISEFCNEKLGDGVSILDADIEEISGQGMKGRFTVSTNQSETTATTQYEAAIGNQRLLENLVSLSEDDTLNLSKALSKYQAAGKSTAILSIRQTPSPTTNSNEPTPPFTPALIFAISDTIRPEAAQVISDLQKTRKVATYMCTGDNETTAKAVASMIGIPPTNIIANVTPAGKADFVRRIQDGLFQNNSTTLTLSEIENQRSTSNNKTHKRPVVAFVGDGVNDSPALAASDVSIAMASGSDVAMNSADFILLNSELNSILNLVVLSRRVFNRVRVNFAWALVYNMALVPVAAGVFYPIVSGHERRMVGDDGHMVDVDMHWRLGPVWAALAMALSSISVVCSSLALGIDWSWLRGLVGFKKG